MSSEKKIIDEDLKVESCPICCDIYNNTNKRKIKCNFCHYKTCIGCFKKYCISSINEPNCMNCNKKWSIEFVYSILPKTFINNDFKKHQEELLLELGTDNNLGYFTIPLLFPQSHISLCPFSNNIYVEILHF